MDKTAKRDTILDFGFWLLDVSARISLRLRRFHMPAVINRFAGMVSMAIVVPKMRISFARSRLESLVPKLCIGTRVSGEPGSEGQNPASCDPGLLKETPALAQRENERKSPEEIRPPANEQSRTQSRTSRVAFLAALAATLLVAHSAFAAPSFDSRLAKAHESLKSGDPDGAIATYRELQTENPESETLYYSMGCAQYKQAEKLVEQNAPRDAVESFKAAKASLEKVLNAPDPIIRKNAQYNHANATAQIAINSTDPQQYEESKTAFEESVKEYEAFLKQYPDHEGARKNLDHVRYLLKSMLQNPPPPQQQQQQGEGENKDQQKQDQQKQDQQKQDQQDKDQQKQEQQQDQQKQEQQQDAQKQEQQQQQAQASQQPQEEKDKQQASEEQEDKEENVEAILQTLEDTDKREQKETKNVRTDLRTSGNWW